MPLRCNVVALLGYIQMDKEGLGRQVKRSHSGHGPEVPNKILFQAFCTWLENNPANLQRQLIFHASKGQRSQVQPIDLNNTGSRIHNKILKSSPPSWYSRSSVLCGRKSNLLSRVFNFPKFP